MLWKEIISKINNNMAFGFFDKAQLHDISSNTTDSKSDGEHNVQSVGQLK